MSSPTLRTLAKKAMKKKRLTKGERKFAVDMMRRFNSSRAYRKVPTIQP